MHDTPYWLVEKNKRIEARLVLFEDIERKMLKGTFFHYYWCLDLLQLDFVFLFGYYYTLHLLLLNAFIKKNIEIEFAVNMSTAIIFKPLVINKLINASCC